MPNMIGAKGYAGRRARLKLAAAAATSLLASCAGGPSPSSSVPVASETQWGALERPRVERLAGDSAALDLRLVEAESGEIVRSWRTMTPRQADPTSLARLVVGSTIETLRELGRVPAWTDPRAAADVAPAPVTYVASMVSLETAGPTFLEADEALARVARLRAGGTLGGSEP